MKPLDVKTKAVRVYQGLIRGLTAAEIGQQEKLPMSSVYWLIQEGGRILDGELRRLTKDRLIQQLVHHHRERIKHLWFTAQTTRVEKVKVSALVQLAAEDKWMVELAERIGIIETKPQEIKHSGGIEVRHQFFAEIVRRSKETHDHVSADGLNGFARN